jgi:hypothetical protein
MVLLADKENALALCEAIELAEEMALEIDEKKFDRDCMACIMSLKKPTTELTISNMGEAELFMWGRVAALAVENPTIANKISTSAE